MKNKQTGCATGAFAIHAAELVFSHEPTERESGHHEILPGDGQPMPPFGPTTL